MAQLTILPENMADWMRMSEIMRKDTYAAHPDYPRLTPTQTFSFIKRFMPLLRRKLQK